MEIIEQNNHPTKYYCLRHPFKWRPLKLSTSLNGLLVEVILNIMKCITVPIQQTMIFNYIQ